MTIGTGKATLSGAGTAKLKVKLSAKARAKLKKSRKAVTAIVQVTFTPASGSATSGAMKIKLKR
jgi:hypothetical protein